MEGHIHKEAQPVRLQPNLEGLTQLSFGGIVRAGGMWNMKEHVARKGERNNVVHN